ncbi:hypothetical protein [Methanolobus vulcani]|uniref:Uncharacterized protein n=1 Tax=Methanolobus vulcani TaxID=38026 RepID=A0A7Z8KRX4_9EURY|nr:hypothetical protein [Methanolobus vulcani]TQD26388.1 hypothetical protein FKV42_06495 [Methanolobus vulcani]
MIFAHGFGGFTFQKRPDGRFCSQCSLVLDHKAQNEIGKYESALSEVLRVVVQSEKAREILESVQKKV